jgi:hypothetical protein
MLKFRGIPYIAFGYGSLFTGRHYEIEKVWYLMDGWRFPIILKSYILNPKRRYTNRFLKKIKDHKLGFKILINIFNDYGEILEEYEYKIGDKMPPDSMLIIRDSNDNYVGIPPDAEHLFQFSELETSASGKVISAGFNPKTQSWCGWSHRAKVCFTLGDKLFEEDFGDDKTVYTQHGNKNIYTLEEAKQSAMNFAAHVS